MSEHWKVTVNRDACLRSGVCAALRAAFGALGAGKAGLATFVQAVPLHDSTRVRN
ncbi:MAG TPA: hypothetical protein VGS19_03485 [Streptosporangiaceae bacterium]|nr:hypothetical protein [Streptosporangiaceae bacterium]